MEINTVHNVSSIIDKICEVNPLFKEKNPTPLLTTKKGRVLEFDRKLIFYDLKEGEVLHLQLAPMFWFYTAFRKDVNEKSEQDLKDDEEIRQIRERKRLEKEKADERAEIGNTGGASDEEDGEDDEDDDGEEDVQDATDGDQGMVGAHDN